VQDLKYITQLCLVCCAAWAMGWVRAREEAEFLRALTAGSYLVSHSPQSNISIVGTQQRKVDNKLFPARLLLNKGSGKKDRQLCAPAK
jgi:hypothetical protein